MKNPFVFKTIVTLILLFGYGCATGPKSGTAKTPELTTPTEQVSLLVALDAIQAGYLKGCVDAWQEQGTKGSFILCREQAIQHRKEVESILNASGK